MTYTFREYPKWVTPHGKKPLIVRSAHEERDVMGEPAPQTDTAEPVQEVKTVEIELPAEAAPAIEEPASELTADEPVEAVAAGVEAAQEPESKQGPAEASTEEAPEDEKDALIAQARALGANANKSWGVAKLKETIARMQQAA